MIECIVPKLVPGIMLAVLCWIVAAVSQKKLQSLTVVGPLDIKAFIYQDAEVDLLEKGTCVEFAELLLAV